MGFPAILSDFWKVFWKKQQPFRPLNSAPKQGTPKNSDNPTQNLKQKRTPLGVRDLLIRW
jgi:hypothetical protein